VRQKKRLVSSKTKVDAPKGGGNRDSKKKHTPPEHENEGKSKNQIGGRRRIEMWRDTKNEKKPTEQFGRKGSMNSEQGESEGTNALRKGKLIVGSKNRKRRGKGNLFSVSVMKKP